MRDDLAFERFVHEHTPTLFATALLLAGDRYAAEELLQDTLARLYPKWATVMAADLPVAYVRRCIANRHVSMRRAPTSRAESSWELPDTSDGTDMSETVATSRTVWQLLGMLPAKQRAAVVMRYFDDLPENEVAAALGCRPASVRSLVSRGIATMRAAYVTTAATAEGSR
jgi:RNA polymerase sigma-70 factor (sigma-E family)